MNPTICACIHVWFIQKNQTCEINSQISWNLSLEVLTCDCYTFLNLWLHWLQCWILYFPKILNAKKLLYYFARGEAENSRCFLGPEAQNKVSRTVEPQKNIKTPMDIIIHHHVQVLMLTFSGGEMAKKSTRRTMKGMTPRPSSNGSMIGAPNFICDQRFQHISLEKGLQDDGGNKQCIHTWMHVWRKHCTLHILYTTNTEKTHG